MPEFGDILRYHEMNDWRFMYLNREMGRQEYWRVLVVAIEPDDDMWVPGETIIIAGTGELVPE